MEGSRVQPSGWKWEESHLGKRDRDYDIVCSIWKHVEGTEQRSVSQHKGYPSIKIAHNIAPHTLVGKIQLKEKVYDRYTAFEMNNEKGDMYDSGKDFVENMLCQNPIMTGVRWFNLPNTMEVLEKVAVQFNKDSSKLIPEKNVYRRDN